MPKYKIKNTNILHNGNLKKIGDVIELSDKEAEKLADVLTLVKEQNKTPVKPADKNQKASTDNVSATNTETQNNNSQQKDGGNK